MACLAAVEEKLDGRVERLGNSRDVAAQLASAVGLPLGDGAAAHAACQGEAILGHVTLIAQDADALADRLTRVGLGGEEAGFFHDSDMEQSL